ncbi:double-stranded RNA-binding protein Staufen homolog 2 isoform X2 [Prorops nasuta]|uniref:double-stranded RNA-binding protein Staufen homolog 2 isoform X2 n=1 Tax=Prorops nasuta TaxID=863751 RepID=UPI0034CDBD13
MLRHQHHSLQNQLRDRMGGPLRPMQQGNMPPSHMSQHPMQQMLSINHQQMHHHMPPPHPAIRQPMMIGINNTPNALARHLYSVALLLLLLSSVAAKSHQPQFDFEQLELIFGPSGCIEGTLVSIGLKDQSLQAQNIQTQYQQSGNQSNQAPQQQQHPQTQSMELNKSPNENSEESREDSQSLQNHANVTNSALANMKEKTPMCLLNELARFNKIQHQYRLTNEQGPAHMKRFTVTLKLGEEEYVAEGPSIKKAQHSAATEALTKTWYHVPPPKPTKAMRGHPGKCPAGSGHLPPTVELNTLAMKRGEPTVYTFRHAPPTPPQTFVAHSFGNFPRLINPRYTGYRNNFHTSEPQLYLVTLKVGDREFNGRGITGQAARHDAASRALEELRQLPLPEEIVNTCGTNENGTIGGIDDPNAELKSPVSLVHESALKRSLPVSFEVVSETGKPHIRTFMTKCTVGEKVTIGEGSSKKVSKKRAAELMLEELKRLPPIPANMQNRSLRLKRKPPATKKKSRNLIKIYSEAETVEEVNPVSRLVQIQQAKREREPVYTLIEEKGVPRRREFIMEVKMGQYSAQGMGPSKKLAKRAAAEALLSQLGYSRPQPQPVKPSIKTGDSENTESKPRKVTFLEDDQVNEVQNHSVGGTIGRQLVPGLLLVDGGQDNKINSGPSVQIIAEELRGQQQQNPSGISSKDQLNYLAQLFNFNVEFTDYPKATSKGVSSMNEQYLSLVTLDTDPPQVCHGTGPTTNASRNQAALKVLRTLSKLGLDNTQASKEKNSSNDGIHIIQVKNNILDGGLDK